MAGRSSGREDNEAVAATQAAKGAVLSKLSQKHVLQIMVPELCVSAELENLHSPLLEDLMEYFVFLYRSGKDIRDIVSASFPTYPSKLSTISSSLKRQ